MAACKQLFLYWNFASSMCVVLCGFIFDNQNTVDSNAVFRQNECFRTSSDLTTWLSVATSGAIYNRFLRPGFNKSLEYNPPVNVNVSIDMNSMASVDEINSEYKIILKIDLEWMDERLRVRNCSTRKPITMPLDAFNLDRVWSPKLGVPNIKDPDTSIIQGEATLLLGQLRTDGYVHTRLNLLLNLFCYLDFALFPFDKQECFIKLESRLYPRSDMILVWHIDYPFRNHANFLMTGFKLVGYKLFDDNTIAKSSAFEDTYGIDMMSQIMVKLVIQREWNNYFLEIYLPSILFVMISWLSFWMHVTAAPARVSLGMTTMLTLVTSSQSTRDKLPRIGYVHALDVWIAFCTGLIFLSLLEFALVSYLFRLRDNKKAHELEKTKKEKIFPRCESTLFSKVTFKRNSTMRQNSPKYNTSQSAPTTDVHLMNKLRHISLTLEPRNRVNSSSNQNKKVVTHLFCCLVWWRGLTCQGDRLANAIDHKCRVIFPVCFAVFNVFYWWRYTQLDQDIATKYNVVPT